MQTGKIYKGTTLISGGGSNGKSAYELWIAAGHTGTEVDFLASLQGNSGYSGAAGELEVVNNLIDGGATAALSAEQGKVLAGMVAGDEEVTIDPSSITQIKTNISPTTPYVWKSLNDVYSKFVPLTNGGDYTLTAGSGKNSIYALLTSDSHVTEETPAFLTGYEQRYTLTAGTSVDLTDIPAGTYICIRVDTENVSIPTITQFVRAENPILRKNDSQTNIFGDEKYVPSMLLFSKMANDLWIKQLNAGTDAFSWEQGGVKGDTGASETNPRAIRTNYIAIEDWASLYVSNNRISGEDFFITFYDENKVRTGAKWDTNGVLTSWDDYIPTGTRYFRMCYYGTPLLYPNNATANAMVIKMTTKSANQSGSLESVYENPVIDNVDLADPCVIDGGDGFFYLFSTGRIDTRLNYRSPDLVHWESCDVPFTQAGISACATDLGTTDILLWGLEIVKVGGKYNLYASNRANPMLVFQSDHPTFGYGYIRQIITTANGLSTDNIDACVRYDLDGTLWMYWGSTRGIYRQKLAADGLSLDTSDTKVHVAGKTVSEDSTRATVFEGAYLYRRKGYWYMFVSAGQYSDYTYCIKVGRCATLDGTFLDKDGNSMVDGYGTTILSSPQGYSLYGPGHNGAIFTDRKNRSYMIFHSHYTGGGSSQRFICLQEIFWDADGWPYFANDGKPQASDNIIPIM